VLRWLRGGAFAAILRLFYGGGGVNDHETITSGAAKSRSRTFRA
jgi:hypothetical protein